MNVIVGVFFYIDIRKINLITEKWLVGKRLYFIENKKI